MVADSNVDLSSSDIKVPEILNVVCAKDKEALKSAKRKMIFFIDF